MASSAKSSAVHAIANVNGFADIIAHIPIADRIRLPDHADQSASEALATSVNITANTSVVIHNKYPQDISSRYSAGEII